MVTSPALEGSDMRIAKFTGLAALAALASLGVYQAQLKAG
jgi:hypothetical protein